jgi:hypothetical protein
MVGMGEHDELENRYAPKFEALISERGLVVEYRRDRAGIDTGLHLFARGEKTTDRGIERPYWRPMASRVWFQLKGVHESTMSADDFACADHVSVPVGVEHLKYWFAAPEPVYLVVYVESVDLFVGLDVRDLVNHEWGEGFFEAIREHDAASITVRIPADAIVDADRIAALVEHRSMRIDGPAFRGRPLGHRIDPIRSSLATPPPEVWRGLVERLLQAHDFVVKRRHAAGELTIVHGVLSQTLLWQSPAFAEYGQTRGEDFREEPQPEQLIGHVCVILDEADARSTFTEEEERAVLDFADAAGENGLELAVFFRAKDLSGTGGLWRSTLNETAIRTHHGGWRQLGLEALTYLVLVSTLVYLDYAADLDWDHATYLPDS